MKILLINHFPLKGSGSGAYTENIAESLIKAKNEVCIIFPENELVKSKSNIKSHPVYFKGQENIKGQLDFNFPCFTTHPRSNQTFYNLTDEQLKEYIEAFKKAIKEECEKFKPDIIHVGHIWLLADIASQYEVPLVITTHGTELIGYKKDYRFKKYADNAAKNAKKIIAISKENKNSVENIFNLNKQNVELMPNGYNDTVFYEKKYDKNIVLKELGINKHYDNIVSFAGKFTEVKGIDIILKAANEYEDGKTITILAGNGDTFDEMKKLASKIKLKDVKFIGNQPHNTLRKIYNISDVLLVPSRKEAFGLVIIEAGACGTPVIGSNEGGIPDIINNKIGMLIEKEDYKELATNVKKIINKEVIFKRKEISNYIKKEYSQDKLIKKLIEIYKEILM